jgi:hypothetical protein
LVLVWVPRSAETPRSLVAAHWLAAPRPDLAARQARRRQVGT